MIRSSLFAVLCLGLFAVPSLADGRKPGSVLFYTVHRSGPTSFTILSVTNTNTSPAVGLGLGGTTNVHYEYYNVTPNAVDPLKPLGKQIFDRFAMLTPGDTRSVLTSCDNATFGDQEGFVVLTAQDPTLFNSPWSFNHLVGSQLVISASGIMYSVNATPFLSLRPPLANSDLNGNMKADLDGFEYELAPDVVIVDSFIALGGARLALINLTPPPFDENTLLFNVWNDNEFAMSITRCFKCWFDQPLSAISPLFTQTFLLSLPNDPAELDLTCDGVGNVETGWVMIDSIAVGGNGIILNGDGENEGPEPPPDGSFIGTITAGGNSLLSGGHQLWTTGLQVGRQP